MEENIEITYPVKTGECMFRNEDGNLCKGESFLINADGEVETIVEIVEYASQEPEF